MEAVASQTALPCFVGKRQNLLYLGKRVMKARVEAGDLGHLRQVLQQDLDGFKRKGLMQRGKRDVTLQIGEDLRIHTD